MWGCVWGSVGIRVGEGIFQPIRPEVTTDNETFSRTYRSIRLLDPPLLLGFRHEKFQPQPQSSSRWCTSILSHDTSLHRVPHHVNRSREGKIRQEELCKRHKSRIKDSTNPIEALQSGSVSRKMIFRVCTERSKEHHSGRWILQAFHFVDAPKSKAGSSIHMCMSSFNQHGLAPSIP